MSTMVSSPCTNPRIGQVKSLGHFLAAQLKFQRITSFTSGKSCPPSPVKVLQVRNEITRWSFPEMGVPPKSSHFHRMFIFSSINIVETCRTQLLGYIFHFFSDRTHLFCTNELLGAQLQLRVNVCSNGASTWGLKGPGVGIDVPMLHITQLLGIFHLQIFKGDVKHCETHPQKGTSIPTPVVYQCIPYGSIWYPPSIYFNFITGGITL